MALIDTVLGMFTKGPKEPLTGSRSEREAKIKDKAGMVINVFAAVSYTHLTLPTIYSV